MGRIKNIKLFDESAVVMAEAPLERFKKKIS
jgi:hypothetical protein